MTIKLESIRLFAPALAFALLASLFGQGMGVAFGAVEDSMKAGLKADADAVLATVYAGDAAKAKSVTDKSWVYYQRAHLHGGALGTFALVVALMLAVLPGHLLLRRLSSIAISVGALGYGLFWWLAGMRAPSLGGTGAAKETLTWLAWPSSAMIVAGTIGAAAVIVMLFVPNRDDA